MTFGNWPPKIHSDKEQKKRLASAKLAKTTPASIDKENEIGIFPGSGASAYETTLNSCTCGDFIHRKLPCKHMYRLAIEIGKLNETVASGTNKNDEISLEKAVAELENLNDDAQKMIKNFLNASLSRSKRVFPCIRNEISESLENCHLLEMLDSPKDALQVFKQKEIISILDEHELIGFKRKMSKEALILWCIENVSDIWEIFPKVIVFRFVEGFNNAQRQVFKYIRRKYDWDSFFDEDMRRISYPHGAIFEDVTVSISSDGTPTVFGNPNVCNFPNDKITKLLTMYGYNRCLGGYDVTKQDVPQEN